MTPPGRDVDGAETNFLSWSMATDCIGTEVTDPGTLTGGTILWLYISWLAWGRVPTGDVGGGLQAICTTFAASSCSAILAPIKMHKSTVLNTLDYSCYWSMAINTITLHLSQSSQLLPRETRVVDISFKASSWGVLSCHFNQGLRKLRFMDVLG